MLEGIAVGELIKVKFMDLFIDLISHIPILSCLDDKFEVQVSDHILYTLCNAVIFKLLFETIVG